MQSTLFQCKYFPKKSATLVFTIPSATIVYTLVDWSIYVLRQMVESWWEKWWEQIVNTRLKKADLNVFESLTRKLTLNLFNVLLRNSDCALIPLPKSWEWTWMFSFSNSRRKKIGCVYSFYFSGSQSQIQVPSNVRQIIYTAIKVS